MRKFLSWHANPGGVAAYIHYWSDGKLTPQQVYVISKVRVFVAKNDIRDAYALRTANGTGTHRTIPP